jgi:RNA polymerase sigma-70 factor (ECF subfamily)
VVFNFRAMMDRKLNSPQRDLRILEGKPITDPGAVLPGVREGPGPAPPRSTPARPASREAPLSQKATDRMAGARRRIRHNSLRYRALVGLETGMQVRSPNRMNAAITDEEAIGRVMRGETSSYEVLATRYHQRLHRLAQKFLHSEADADDAVQGAHLLALRHIDQYAGRSSYLTWMSSITVNVALGQMRQRKGVVEAGEEQVRSLRSPMRDPEQQAIDRQMDGILAAALERLPPAYGKVFRLREMETLTDLLHHASGSGPVSIGCDFENGVVTRFLST